MYTFADSETKIEISVSENCAFREVAETQSSLWASQLSFSQFRKFLDLALYLFLLHPPPASKVFFLLVVPLFLSGGFRHFNHLLVCTLSFSFGRAVYWNHCLLLFIALCFQVQTFLFFSISLHVVLWDMPWWEIWKYCIWSAKNTHSSNKYFPPCSYWFE